MRIKDRKKFIARISQIIVIVGSIILTIFAMQHVNRAPGVIGGEHLIWVLGLVVAMIIEGVYQDTKGKRKHGR